MNIKSLFIYPSKHLVSVIPCIIILALICGRLIDTSFLKTLILPIAIFTIYPAMIGFQPRELLRLTDLRLMVVNLFFNFFILPLAALLVGNLLLQSWPELRIGLLIISVVPGGNMVVAFTMMFKGNVKAALKISATNLILGSLLAPVYLYVLAGTLVEIDIWNIGETIALVVFIPLSMGVVTYNLLLKRMSQQQFKERVKPLLPATSVWGMMYLIFTSVSMKAALIFSYPALMFQALSSMLLWYLITFLLCIVVGRFLFNREDSMTLILNVELRNLPICIGLAVTAFPPQTAMMVALAFLFQQQLVIWFAKIESRYNLL